MKPIEFSEQNIVWAKNQKEYQALPAFTDERQTVSCWKLNWYERLKLLITGNLWLHQMNFGEALQPQYITVDKPFQK